MTNLAMLARLKKSLRFNDDLDVIFIKMPHLLYNLWAIHIGVFIRFVTNLLSNGRKIRGNQA